MFSSHFNTDSTVNMELFECWTGRGGYIRALLEYYCNLLKFNNWEKILLEAITSLSLLKWVETSKRHAQNWVLTVVKCTEILNVQLSTAKCRGLNKYINPFRGQIINIFPWVKALVRLQHCSVCAQTKIGGGRTKQYCTVFVLAGENTSPNIMYFNMQAKQGQTRPTLECCKW